MADESAISTPQKTRGKPFAPGNNANPAGRPKGSRNKLGESFIQALYADFEEHGESVIERVRVERPQDYMKVVASLLPKEFKIETTSDLTDEQLDARIRALADIIGVESRVGQPPGREKAPKGAQTAH